jgi:hypothetical protein
MKLLLPLAMLAAVWSFCGLGNTQNTSTQQKPPANQAPTPVTDRDSVRRELISLANQITQAAKDGDVSYLAKIATDDFRLTDIDGKVKSKNQALTEIKEEKNIRSFDILDANLVSLEGSTAVLTYTIKVIGKNGRSAKAGTTDTYVQQDGKWMLKSEQQTLLR